MIPLQRRSPQYEWHARGLGVEAIDGAVDHGSDHGVSSFRSISSMDMPLLVVDVEGPPELQSQKCFWSRVDVLIHPLPALALSASISACSAFISAKISVEPGPVGCSTLSGSAASATGGEGFHFPLSTLISLPRRSVSPLIRLGPSMLSRFAFPPRRGGGGAGAL